MDDTRLQPEQAKIPASSTPLAKATNKMPSTPLPAATAGNRVATSTPLTTTTNVNKIATSTPLTAAPTEIGEATPKKLGLALGN